MTAADHGRAPRLHATELLACALATPARSAETAAQIAALDAETRDALLALAGWHGVTPALWAPLGSHSATLPDDCAAYLEATSHFNARRNARLVDQAREIAAAAAAAGIPAVFLKGTAFLLRGLHADPAARLVGDIDLLVPADRLEAAAAALVAAGYRRLPDRVAHAHDPVRLLRCGRPGLVELHQAPLAFALAPALSAEGVIDRSVPAPGAPGARIPCPDDLAVHAIAHAMLQDHGFRLAELRLADALDLARLAEGRAGAIDWRRVAARLARVPDGGDAFAFCLLASRELLAAPLPAPEASRVAARRLALWRRRAGGPAPSLARRAALIGIYARGCLWRLRHAPDERRRLLGRLLTPAAYPAAFRTLATVAADGPPATPHPRPDPRR